MTTQLIHLVQGRRGVPLRLLLVPLLVHPTAALVAMLTVRLLPRTKLPLAQVSLVLQTTTSASTSLLPLQLRVRLARRTLLLTLPATAPTLSLLVISGLCRQRTFLPLSHGGHSEANLPCASRSRLRLHRHL